MKNIHLLPTDKPSRFSLNSSGKYHLTNQLHTNSPNFTNQHIYITNDEDIKEGDWVYSTDNNTSSCNIYQIIKYNQITGSKPIGFGGNCYNTEQGIGIRINTCKKIILTTDQDLIKDGVQAIEDEFLEWFIKNPT